jgi:hypothetical protein
MSTETLQKAIQAAYEYLIIGLSTSGTPKEKISNFRVEEAETNEKDNYKITLSYDITGDFVFEKEREYKDFEVTPAGKVLSMKIRKI